MTPSVSQPTRAGAVGVKKSALLKGLIKYAVAVALLAFVVAMNWSGIRKLTWPPVLPPLLGIAAILSVATAIQYYRWYLLVRALDLPFTLRNAVRLGLVGTFYNTFLPGSVGGDFVKAYFIAQGHPGRGATAVATVIADRLIGLFGLVLFAAAVGGAFWAAGNEKIAGNSKLQIIILGCAAAVVVAALVYAGLGLVSKGAAGRFGGRLHKLPMGKTLDELWFTVWQYRQKPRTVLAVVAMSAFVHTGFVLNFHLAVQVFPPANPELMGTLPEHFVIAPIGYIVQAVIPLPGGLGAGELTFGGLYELIRGETARELGLPEGSAAAVGLAGRLAMRLIEWSIGLVGYVAYLRMRAELPGGEKEKEVAAA
jgi:glycosyltransferase 2 family protein